MSMPEGIISSNISVEWVLQYESTQTCGNTYIMDRATFERVLKLRREDDRYIIEYSSSVPRLFGCRIVFVKPETFMKGIL